MDRIDSLILAALSLLALSLLVNMRWNRGSAKRMERRVGRSLKRALQRRATV